MGLERQGLRGRAVSFKWAGPRLAPWPVRAGRSASVAHAAGRRPGREQKAAQPLARARARAHALRRLDEHGPHAARQATGDALTSMRGGSGFCFTAAAIPPCGPHTAPCSYPLPSRHDQWSLSTHVGAASGGSPPCSLPSKNCPVLHGLTRAALPRLVPQARVLDARRRHQSIHAESACPRATSG